MSLYRNKEKGFTLIELVIVLAIAALIIVGVLIAVSGAQKSRRDAQRRTDLSRVLSNIETYAADNGSVYPASGAASIPPAAYSGMLDPLSNSAYQAVAAPVVPNPSNTKAAALNYFLSGNACDGSTPMGPKQFRITITLETGGTACLDTH